MNPWYSSLIKPPLTPPPSYFPIAWSILYFLMTVSFFIVLSKPHTTDKHIAITLFLFQFILNFTLSYVFFEMKSITLGLIDVVFLLLFLILTIIYFFKISKLAGILLIPYLLQVIFALYLNSGILILN